MRIAVLGALAIALLGAGSALAEQAAPAGTALTLQLTGADGIRPDKACGSAGRFSQYRAGGRVSVHGRVIPAPGRRVAVAIVVKRCFGKRFETVKTLTVRAARDGQYNGSFPVSVPSKCFVQASHSGARSPRAYFRVR